MKKEIRLKNINDLRMTKQQLTYDVKLQEEVLGSALLKLRTSFSDSLKTTARLYSQKLIIAVLLHLLKRKNDTR